MEEAGQGGGCGWGVGVLGCVCVCGWVGGGGGEGRVERTRVRGCVCGGWGAVRLWGGLGGGVNESVCLGAEPWAGCRRQRRNGVAGQGVVVGWVGGWVGLVVSGGGDAWVC